MHSRWPKVRLEQAQGRSSRRAAPAPPRAHLEVAGDHLQRALKHCLKHARHLRLRQRRWAGWAGQPELVSQGRKPCGDRVCNSRVEEGYYALLRRSALLAPLWNRMKETRACSRGACYAALRMLCCALCMLCWGAAPTHLCLLVQPRDDGGKQGQHLRVAVCKEGGRGEKGKGGTQPGSMLFLSAWRRTVGGQGAAGDA